MKNEYGRSMIEMLGVLAIIGVLSIGGLAGYTMAMNRHKANNILDYAQKCGVIAQTQGDGSQAINPAVSCATATFMGEDTLPTGVTSIMVGRVANGDTTVTVTFDAATNSVSEALANRIGAANAAVSYTYSPDAAGTGWNAVAG